MFNLKKAQTANDLSVIYDNDTTLDMWSRYENQYEVRPVGWKDTLGTVSQFDNSWIVSEPKIFQERYETKEDAAKDMYKRHINESKNSVLNFSFSNKKQRIKTAMQDSVLLSVTKIVDDDTGIWANDLCDYSIHSLDLEDFLKTNGKTGAEEIFKMLDQLKISVEEIYKSLKKGENDV